MQIEIGGKGVQEMRPTYSEQASTGNRVKGLSPFLPTSNPHPLTMHIAQVWSILSQMVSIASHEWGSLVLSAQRRAPSISEGASVEGPRAPHLCGPPIPHSAAAGNARGVAVDARGFHLAPPLFTGHLVLARWHSGSAQGNGILAQGVWLPLCEPRLAVPSWRCVHASNKPRSLTFGWDPFSIFGGARGWGWCLSCRIQLYDARHSAASLTGAFRLVFCSSASEWPLDTTLALVLAGDAETPF